MSTQADAPTEEVHALPGPLGTITYSTDVKIDGPLTEAYGPTTEVCSTWDPAEGTLRTLIYGNVQFSGALTGDEVIDRAVGSTVDCVISDLRKFSDAYKTGIARIIRHHAATCDPATKD